MQTLIFILCYFTVTNANSLSFTTTSGRQIPISELSHLFRGTPQDQWHAHIFEVSSDHHLVTHSHQIPLHSVPFQTRLFTPANGAPVIINGKERYDHTFEYLSKSVDDFTISYNLDKTAFAMSFRRSMLHPLDPTLHPGVFIEVQVDESLDDDDSILPTPSSQNNSLKYSSKAARLKCRRDDPGLVLEIAVAFDATLCKRFATYQTTLAYVTDVLYMAMMPYHRQTCLRPKIVYYEGFCDVSKDPYRQMVSLNDTKELMERLRLLWLSQRDFVNRDLVYLFTDQGYDNSRSRAYMHAVCNKYYNTIWTTILSSSNIAHLIGHGLGLKHTFQGDIMTVDRDWYGPRYFDRYSLRKIRKFILERGSCLSEYKGSLPLLIPEDVTATCQTGFKGNSPISTDWSVIGRMPFGFNSGTSYVTVYYQQWEKELYVILLAEDGYRIMQYKRRPATKRLPWSAIGEWVDFGVNSSPAARTVWSWSEIDRPPAIRTCCGRKIFIHLVVKLCNDRSIAQCVNKFLVFQVLVRC